MTEPSIERFHRSHVYRYSHVQGGVVECFYWPWHVSLPESLLPWEDQIRSLIEKYSSQGLFTCELSCVFQGGGRVLAFRFPESQRAVLWYCLRESETACVMNIFPSGVRDSGVSYHMYWKGDRAGHWSSEATDGPRSLWSNFWIIHDDCGAYLANFHPMDEVLSV